MTQPLEAAILALSALGVAITAISVGVGAFGLYFLFAQRRLRRSIQSFESRIRKAETVLVIAADLAIGQLPKMTMTQQAPSSVIEDVDFIQDAFSDQEGSAVLSTLNSRGYVRKIHYVRGISHLYREHRHPLLLSNAIEPAIEHFAQALSDTSGASLVDDRLEVDIITRYIQAARQYNKYDLAEEGLRLLKLALQRRYDDQVQWHEVYRSLYEWNAGLLALQKGMGLKGPARMDNVCSACLFFDIAYQAAFPSEAQPLENLHRLVEVDRGTKEFPLGSLAFYRFKSYMVRDFLTSFQSNDFFNDHEIINVIDTAITLFEHTRQQLSEDLYISAIYSYCTGLMSKITHIVPRLNHSGKWIHRNLNPDLNSVDFANDLLEAAERSARHIRIREGAHARLIYTESTERLEPISQFIDLAQRTRLAESWRDLRELFVKE